MIESDVDEVTKLKNKIKKLKEEITRLKYDKKSDDYVINQLKLVKQNLMKSSGLSSVLCPDHLVNFISREEHCILCELDTIEDRLTKIENKFNFDN